MTRKGGMAGARRRQGIRAWSVRLAALLGMAWLWPAGPGYAIESGDRRTFADGLYARGMYELAAKEYEGLVNAPHDMPDRDAVRYRLAVCLSELGRHVEADKLFSQIIANEPPSEWRFRAAYKRGELYMRLKRWPDATGLFKELLALNPDADIRAAALYALGECCMATGQIEEGVRAFGALRTTLGDTEMGVYATLKLGMIAAEGIDSSKEKVSLERLRPALDAFAEVQKKAPSPRVAAEAMFQEGELYYRAGYYQESAAAFRRLQAAHPADTRVPAARLRAAWATQRAGLFKECMDHVDALLQQAGTSAGDRLEWGYLRANCQRQLQQYDQAYAAYTNLLAQHPGSPWENEMLLEAALCQQRRGRHREALALALRAKPEGERRGERDWLCAESCRELKEMDRAIQFYRQLVQDSPDHPLAADAGYRLGYALEEKGDFQAAAAQFRAVAAKPGTDRAMAAQARFAAGLCLDRAGQGEAAIREWEALIRDHAGHALVSDALYRKSLAEMKLGRLPEADKTLDELRKRTGHQLLADALYLKGTLAAKMEKNADAETHLRAALAASPREALRQDIVLALGVLLYNTKSFEQAETMLAQLAGTDAASRVPPALLYWLADRDLERGKPALARTAAAVLCKQEDRLWQEAGHLLAGRAGMIEQRNPAAAAAFEACLAVGAASRYAADAALRLGDLRLAAKQYEPAEAAYARAAALAADDALNALRARGYRGLARTWDARGNPAEAARYYMCVAVLYDDPAMVPECLAAAAAAYRRAGDEASAEKALAERKTRYPNAAAPAGEGGR